MGYKMIIEIVDFFLKTQNEKMMAGSMRINLPEKGLNILGIYVTKIKSRWNFSVPYIFSKHNETGEMIRFPLINFNNDEEKKEFINELRNNGIKYIENRLNDVENPLTLPIQTRKYEKKGMAPNKNRRRPFKKV
jgi:hypothetical protein